MDNYDVKCPFCGKSIVGQPLYKLPFEETVKRDYNIGRTWAGSYLQETKHKIRFNVRCCKECYEKDEKAENFMMKYHVCSSDRNTRRNWLALILSF